MRRVDENGLALDIGMGRRSGRMNVRLSEAAEGSVESELALQAGRARGVRRAISELESLNLFEKGFEETVIHVSLVPFGHHLGGEFLAELHGVGGVLQLREGRKGRVKVGRLTGSGDVFIERRNESISKN